MIRRLALALVAAAALVGPARAAEPIRAFPIATIEQLGRAIHRQDSAAWVATDALVAKVRNPAGEGLVGWIVVDAGPNQKVRFLRKAGGRLEAGYDIEVTPDLKTTLSQPADRTLSTDEILMFTARETATDALKGQPVCRPGYNTAIVKDPEGDGWLVWLMAPMPEAGTIPIGGHYRISVSADGRTVRRRDALSASCMVLPKSDDKAAKPVAAFVTHVVSPTPVETHVFLQLQSGRPLFVGAGDHFWSIEAGRVQDRGLLKDLAAQSSPTR